MKIKYKEFFKTLAIFFLLNSFVFGADNTMNPVKELKELKLKLIEVGDPILRHVSQTLTKEQILSADIQQLILLMKNTMHAAPGVGLAAPQIGVSLQIAVIEDRAEYLSGLKPEEIQERVRRPIPFHVIINPKITLLEMEKQATFHEGCLSVNGYVGAVSRALKVKVEALNEKAEPITIEAEGWYARILQHEIDHLNGILYIDRMQTEHFTTISNFKKFKG